MTGSNDNVFIIIERGLDEGESVLLNIPEGANEFPITYLD
jgi:hypothetical protein